MEGPQGYWAPLSNPVDEWVQVGREDTSCFLYSELHESPWGGGGAGQKQEGDGEGADFLEEITRHVACCLGPEYGFPSDAVARPPFLAEDDVANSPDYVERQRVYEEISLTYDPIWFDDVTSPWGGGTYEDGVKFCKDISKSRTVCPYRVYCPSGPGNPPFRGVQGTDEGGAEWLAPLYDEQALWLNVGSTDTCVWKGKIDEGDEPKVKYVLCCLDDDVVSGKEEHGTEGGVEPALTAQEQAVFDHMSPQWYGRNEGYTGSTHQEAEAFCKSIDGRELCLPEAYCPNEYAAEGTRSAMPLYLRMKPFSGEQWAPTALNANSWMLIGELEGKPDSTCSPYEAYHEGAQPLWGLDGTRPDIAQHVLCCRGSSAAGKAAPAVVSGRLRSYWFMREDGDIHTHEHSMEYCKEKMDSGFLCPYEILCPDGRSGLPFTPPSFMAKNEQWVPILDNPNIWVLVGPEDDPDRLCKTHGDLIGNEANFHDIDEYEAKTKFVLCCGPP